MTLSSLQILEARVVLLIFAFIFKRTPAVNPLMFLQNVWLRIFPFEIKELMNYDILIYIDANVRILHFMFVEHIIKLCAKADEFDSNAEAHTLGLHASTRRRKLFGRYTEIQVH